jgi:hypothetical protein
LNVFHFFFVHLLPGLCLAHFRVGCEIGLASCV